MEKKFGVILIFALAANAVLAGGGWPQKKGKGFFKLSQSAIIGNKYFDRNGDVIDITTLAFYTSSAYAEYGITDRLTAIAYVPFFVRATLNEQRASSTNALLNEGDQMNAFGDVDLSIKYGIIQNSAIALSATLTLGIPSGEPTGGNSQILQSGDGEFNQLLMIDAGKGFKKWYTNAGVGFNNRTKGFSDEFRYTFEIGFTGWEKWFTALKVNGAKPMLNDNDNIDSPNGIFSNRVEYLAFGPEISYKMKPNFGITGYAGFATAAKRIMATPNFTVGLFYTL